MSRSSLPDFRDEQAERNEKKDSGVHTHGEGVAEIGCAVELD